MHYKTLQSIGIDIGTTTTQVVFSRLSLVNRAPASRVPAYEFIKREIIYHSPVSLTPINHQGIIDESRLREFIYQQIHLAGLPIHEIETGAIIITGETAKAENARAAIMSLSEELGDFVVATAGPHLESIIAGRGSGAQRISEEKHWRVLNIDIGGGTSNYASFVGGKVIESACLNIGGRLIEIDSAGQANYIHAPAMVVIRDVFGKELTPELLSIDHLRRIVERMAEVIVEVITGQLSPLAAHLLMTPELKDLQSFDAVFLSGGVGECYQQLAKQDLSDFAYGDIGVLLARALRQNIGLAKLSVQMPKQTVRATVIGAGAHSLSLSGSTIWLKQMELPLKNIPVVHPALDWQSTPAELVKVLSRAIEQMDLDAYQAHYAIALDASLPNTYEGVSLAAQALALFFKQYVNPQQTALVIVHQDLGKALGMLLQPLIEPQQACVIDEVFTQAGDYIDIGQSYFGGEIVPLTVKSLAFPS